MSNPFTSLADTAELFVMERRALIDRHRELSSRRKWNADLIPSEEARLIELEEIAQMVRLAADSPAVQDAYRVAWRDRDA